MNDASKEDERFNASKVRGSGYLEKAQSSGSGEHAAGLGRWKNDPGRGTYRSKRRDEVRLRGSTGRPTDCSKWS